MKTFEKSVLGVVLIITIVASCFNGVIAAPAKNLTSMYAILGETLQTEGMRVWVGEGVNPEIKREQNIPGYVLDPSKTASSYLNVDIDDNIAKNIDNGTNFEVEIDYYDSSMLGSLSLKYPGYINSDNIEVPTSLTSAEVMNNEAEILELRGSNSWRTKKWRLDRAAMNNFLNGADLQFNTNTTYMGKSRDTVLISSIRVNKLDTKNIIDVEVSSKKMGNIFFTGDKMEFDITLSAADFKALAKKYNGTDMTVECKLWDNEGNLIDTKTEQVVFKSGRTATCHVEFSPTKYNTYMLEVEVKDESKRLSSLIKRECSYVKSAKGEIQNPTGWINIVRCEEDRWAEQAEIIVNSGFSGVRWSSRTDRTVPTAYGSGFDKATGYSVKPKAVNVTDVMMRAGIKVSSYHGLNIQGSSIRFSDVEPYMLPKTDEGREEWLKMELATIDAMGGENLDMYQIGNEWDIIQPLPDDMHARNVARLLKYVYPRIKAVYPNLTIGTGGVCNSDEKFWIPFIEEGGLDNIDVLCMHTYTQADDPITLDPVYGSEKQARSLIQVRKYLDESGHEDMPIYSTECGYSARKYTTPGEYHQACWIMQQYLLEVQEGLLDRFTVFSLSSGEQWSEGEHNFGIIRFERNDFGGYSSPEAAGYVAYGAKPAFVMLSALNHMMYDTEYVARDDINKDTIAYRYKKTTSGNDLLTMFSRSDAEDVCYDLGTNELTYYDMYGNETKMISTDGKYHFTATLEPFFVEGRFSKFERVYTAAVEPVETLIEANYGSEYTVKIRNNSGRSLKIEALPAGKSTVLVTEVKHPDKSDGEVTLKLASNAHIGVERIPFKIYDEAGAYYNGNLVLKYGQALALATSTEYTDGDWYLVTTLTNRNKQSNIKGMLNCIAPQGWVEPIEVEVQAGDVYTVKQKIVDKGSGSKFDVSMEFASTDGINYYFNTQLTFAFIKKADNIKIDGLLDDWDDGFIYFDKFEEFIAIHGFDNQYNGYSDMNARVALKYDEEYLYLGAEVYDDYHSCAGVTASETWSQDSVQLGLSLDIAKTTASSSFEEVTFAFLDGKPAIHRHKTVQTDLAEPTKLQNYEFEVTQNNNSTFYEWKISWKDLLGKDKLEIKAGGAALIGIVVNENDKTGRKGYFEFGGGIANVKDYKRFAEFKFVE